MSACFGGVVGFEILVKSCDGLFFTGIQIGDEHRKLVASEPGDYVRTSKAAIEYRGRVDECVVAFVMSKLVVDPFHPVEVDEEEEQVFLLPAGEVEIRRRLFK